MKRFCSASRNSARRQLSVFRGGCTHDAAAAVMSVAAVTLSTLLNKSLLRSSVRPDHARRVGMHELVRQYAEAQLCAASKAAEVQQRHLHYFVRLAEDAEPQLIGAEQAQWLQRLDVEHGNLRVALAWALQLPGAEAALRLRGALARFWKIDGHHSEGWRWLQQALKHAGSAAAPVEVRLKALNGAGTLARLQGNLGAATVCLERCLALGRELNDSRWIAIALNGLGLVARRQGGPERAVALYEDSLAWSRVAGDKLGIVNALSNLVGVVNGQGDHARAATLYEESLAFSREAGDQLDMAADLNNLGNVVFDLGDYARAAALYEERLALYTTGGN